MKKILLLLCLAFVFNFIDLNAQNLLTNGGFETWAGGGPGGITPTGWTIANPQNGAISQNTTLKNELTSSCRIIANGGNYTISQSVAVTAGKTYTFRVSYYIETSAIGGKEARINCNFRNSGGTAVAMTKEDSLALIGPGSNNAFPSVTGAWQTYTYDVVVPTGATTFFFSAAVVRTATVSWDNFSLAENTTPTIYKYVYTTAGGYNYSPSITGLDYTVSGPSADQSFTVKASNLTTTNLTITAPTNFEISATSGTSFSGQSSLQIPVSNGSVSPITLYVRLKTGLTSSITYAGNVSLSSTGATTQIIPVSGYVGTPLPIITSSVTTLSGFSYAEGAGPSTQQSFTVSGSLLTTGITITAPTNFEISSISGTAFTNSIALTGVTLATTPIYIRLKSGLASASYSGSLTLTSGSTTKNIDLSGNVNGITISATTLSGFSYVVGAGPSTIQSINVSGIGLTTYLIVTGPTNNFEISSTTGTSFSSIGQILLAANTVTPTPIYVRLKSGLSVANSYTGNITISSTGFTSKTVSLTGNVLSLTALNEITNDNLNAYASGSEIVVQGAAKDELVSLYTITGMRLQTIKSQGDQITIPAKSGAIYLVKTASKVLKVIL